MATNQAISDLNAIAKNVHFSIYFWFSSFQASNWVGKIRSVKPESPGYKIDVKHYFQRLRFEGDQFNLFRDPVYTYTFRFRCSYWTFENTPDFRNTRIGWEHKKNERHVLMTDKSLLSVPGTSSHGGHMVSILQPVVSWTRINHVSSCPFFDYESCISMGFYCIFVSVLMLFLLLFNSFAIHMSVDRVYTGMKSPTKGMNSIMFTAVDILLLVILYSKLTTIASRISPKTGIPNKGAAT